MATTRKIPIPSGRLVIVIQACIDDITNENRHTWIPGPGHIVDNNNNNNNKLISFVYLDNYCKPNETKNGMYGL